MLRLLGAEPIVGLGAGRALLMQLAHPGVARGVAEHSDFAERPLARLFGTLDFLLITAFGTPEQVERIAAKVRGIHTAVRGEGYSGNDPGLQLWVNATLIDSALYLHERLGRRGRPGEDEAEEYYRQARIVAEVLGCPLEEQPADLASFRAYMDEMVASLEVDDNARKVAAAVLHPRKLRALAPGLAVFRVVTTALLPEPFRERYGLPWGARHRRAAALVLGTAALGHRVTPGPLRRPPQALLVRLASHRVERTLRERRARRRAGRAERAGD
ncbi:oxygenase MpaB family protein [Actinomadura sp. WMMB 499]|uniref:oxygenase MpaB family protein n=1 Tax=Actinomadura sp. WMMB 499 TaxID=1219491 RepID=UPI0020C807F9|nr:oxygenase MpaB family protein [Actinomadura sp. WMMB 499]